MQGIYQLNLLNLLNSLNFSTIGSPLSLDGFHVNLIVGLRVMELSLLKAIFEAMEQGIVFIDDQNRIAYCNPAAERIRTFGLRSRSSDQSILDFHPRKSHPKVLKIIEDLKSGKVDRASPDEHPDGAGKFYDNTYSAVRGPNNEYRGMIVVTQEVTERKKAEDELEKRLRNLNGRMRS